MAVDLERRVAAPPPPTSFTRLFILTLETFPAMRSANACFTTFASLSSLPDRDHASTLVHCRLPDPLRQCHPVDLLPHSFYKLGNHTLWTALQREPTDHAAAVLGSGASNVRDVGAFLPIDVIDLVIRGEMRVAERFELCFVGVEREISKEDEAAVRELRCGVVLRVRGLVTVVDRSSIPPRRSFGRCRFVRVCLVRGAEMPLYDFVCLPLVRPVFFCELFKV